MGDGNKLLARHEFTDLRVSPCENHVAGHMLHFTQRMHLSVSANLRRQSPIHVRREDSNDRDGSREVPDARCHPTLSATKAQARCDERHALRSATKAQARCDERHALRSASCMSATRAQGWIGFLPVRMVRFSAATSGVAGLGGLVAPECDIEAEALVIGSNGH